MSTTLLRFGFVGAVGFIVDAAMLLALVKVLHLAPLLGRVASFAIAASVTFFLNQRFTFKLPDRFNVYRWASYLVATAIGACINLSVYRFWIAVNGDDAVQLVVGTAVGSLVAMFVNYFVSSSFVFRSTK